MLLDRYLHTVDYYTQANKFNFYSQITYIFGVGLYIIRCLGVVQALDQPLPEGLAADGTVVLFPTPEAGQGKGR